MYVYVYVYVSPPGRCGWGCPYLEIRSRLAYRAEFIAEARRYLARVRLRHADLALPIYDAPRVLSIHWRRGDFLTRGGYIHTYIHTYIYSIYVCI